MAVLKAHLGRSGVRIFQASMFNLPGDILWPLYSNTGRLGTPRIGCYTSLKCCVILQFTITRSTSLAGHQVRYCSWSKSPSKEHSSACRSAPVLSGVREFFAWKLRGRSVNKSLAESICALKSCRNHSYKHNLYVQLESE